MFGFIYFKEIFNSFLRGMKKNNDVCSDLKFRLRMVFLKKRFYIIYLFGRLIYLYVVFKY